MMAAFVISTTPDYYLHSVSQLLAEELKHECTGDIIDIAHCSDCIPRWASSHLLAPQYMQQDTVGLDTIVCLRACPSLTVRQPAQSS